MNNLKIVGLVLITCCFITRTYSQGYTSIHFGVSFPTSDFASDDLDNEVAGAATIGFNIGLQYIYPLLGSGLGLFAGIDLNYNALQKDVRDDVVESYESKGITNADYTFYKYINIPITAGLNYTYWDEEEVGLFANAGLALNSLKVTNMEIVFNGQTARSEIDLTNSLGFKTGVGVWINKQTSITLDYLYLGNHSIEGTIKRISYPDNIDGKAKIDLITATIGFKF